MILDRFKDTAQGTRLCIAQNIVIISYTFIYIISLCCIWTEIVLNLEKWCEKEFVQVVQSEGGAAIRLVLLFLTDTLSYKHLTFILMMTLGVFSPEKERFIIKTFRVTILKTKVY